MKKVYSEKWTKKRGSAEKQFTGHTVDHFINGVPNTAREYATCIAEITNENIFKLLTNPKYFNEQMHWQERRKLLLEVCGDVEDSEVIASNKALTKLPEILGDHSMDDFRKIIAARRNEINKELEKLPVRIDEVSQGLPALDEQGLKLHENTVKELEVALEEKEARKNSIKAGGGSAEVKNELAELSAKMLDYKNRFREEKESQLAPKRSELSDLLNRQTEIGNLKSGLGRKIEGLELDIQQADRTVAEMRDKWHLEDAKVFEFEDKDTCPTCGQSLPADQVKEARDKAMATFNQEKADRLSIISETGKEAKSRLDKMTAELAGLKTELESITAEHQEIGAKINAVSVEVNADTSTAETTEEYQKMAALKAELENKVTAADSDNASLLKAIDDSIAEIKSEIRGHQAELAKADQYEQGQKRIKELEAQEKDLAKEYEQLEQELYLTEEFIRSKVKLLEELINKRFELARFKLFNIQVNGGIEECCDTLYKGVPYPDLNNGSKINVGLDICRTLAEHFGINPPIFVDNKEAITGLIDVNSQVIALVVSEKDKSLRIETVEQQIKEAV